MDLTTEAVRPIEKVRKATLEYLAQQRFKVLEEEAGRTLLGKKAGQPFQICAEINDRTGCLELTLSFKEESRAFKEEKLCYLIYPDPLDIIVAILEEQGEETRVRIEVPRDASKDLSSRAIKDLLVTFEKANKLACFFASNMQNINRMLTEVQDKVTLLNQETSAFVTLVTKRSKKS